MTTKLQVNRRKINRVYNIHISEDEVVTFSLTYRGRAIDARLHTAVSVGLVYSIISVHKLDDFMVPKFCWLLFLLQES